jgi:hypothetical protein
MKPDGHAVSMRGHAGGHPASRPAPAALRARDGRAASGDIPDQRRNALRARQDQFWGAAIIAGAGQSGIVASVVSQQTFSALDSQVERMRG